MKIPAPAPMAVPNNVGNRANQMGNFRELSVGAGASVFKMVNPWVWGGGVKPDNATFKIYLPTGALTTTGTINATGGTISGDLSVTGSIEAGGASDSSLTISGDDGAIFFRYDNVIKGAIFGWQDDVSGEDEGLVLQSQASGVAKAQLRFRISNIGCSVNFLPTVSLSKTLGNSGNIWNEVWGKKIVASGSGAVFSISGDDGETGTFGYTDDNGNDRFLVFKGGILTDQHS